MKRVYLNTNIDFIFFSSNSEIYKFYSLNWTDQETCLNLPKELLHNIGVESDSAIFPIFLCHLIVLLMPKRRTSAQWDKVCITNNFEEEKTENSRVFFGVIFLGRNMLYKTMTCIIFGEWTTKIMRRGTRASSERRQFNISQCEWSVQRSKIDL